MARQKPEFYEGQDILLCPRERTPDWRIRGKIVKVRVFASTVLYYTDIPWPQDDHGQPLPDKGQMPCGGLSARWLLPVDVVTCLSEVIE